MARREVKVMARESGALRRAHPGKHRALLLRAFHRNQQPEKPKTAKNKIRNAVRRFNLLTHRRSKSSQHADGAHAEKTRHEEIAAGNASYREDDGYFSSCLFLCCSNNSNRIQLTLS